MPKQNPPLEDESAVVIASGESVEDIDEESEVVPYRYSLTAYGADYPVDGLVKRLEAGDILVPTFEPEIPIDGAHPGFQRQFIWTRIQCERFIESLLLGLPVPGIFLVKQRDGKLMVLDGQQRLRTLQAYFKGMLRDTAFRLEAVQKKYQGKVYENLDPEDRRRLDDSIIHATIMRQDEPADDQSSIYLVFERLNSGGTSLSPQEIRVALHRGKFARLLRDLNSNKSWRLLFGPKSTRLKDQEMILRFFALYLWSDHYESPMKDFLNRYMGKNADCALHSEEYLTALFDNTMGVILRTLGQRAFYLKSTVNAAVLDSISAGIATVVEKAPDTIDAGRLKAAYRELLTNETYLKRVRWATANEENVKNRLAESKKSFLSALG